MQEYQVYNAIYLWENKELIVRQKPRALPIEELIEEMIKNNKQVVLQAMV